MQLKSLAVDSLTILSLAVQPLFLALLAFYMLRVGNTAEGAYAVVGSGLTGLWSATALHCVMAIVSERYGGNLEALVAVPRSMTLIIRGKLVTDLGVSMVTIVVAYSAAAWVGRWPFELIAPRQFVLASAVCLVTFIECGVIFAAVGLLRPDLHRWLPLLGYPIPILSGFLFPIDTLPASVAAVAKALPTYWAARLAHLTSSGPEPPQASDWALGAALIVFLSITATAAMSRARARARRNGTLSAT